MTDEGGEDAMISKAEAKELINDLFEEEALVIGGLVAVHEMDDDLVWRLVKNLDVIRGKVLRRLEDKAPADGDGSPPRRPNLKPHPAIEDFLLSLRRA
ncbi:MAG: hypothetical protein C4529_11880 [Deltaproteobacteria bacterium]|nr:MAG: hypothetical protein C4529_11880 [Deltaproteobacteria bacterium]